MSIDLKMNCVTNLLHTLPQQLPKAGLLPKLLQVVKETTLLVGVTVELIKLGTRRQQDEM